jgi:5-methylthioadenosine/S-adenosylhomocysteine deaminase
MRRVSDPPSEDSHGTGPRRIDLLVEADTVLTMEPADTALRNGAIAVDAGRIVEVGSGDDLRRRYRADQVLGGPGHLALPGFVNAHQHLTGDRLIHSMIPDDLEAGRAIFEWAVPAHRAHTPDDDELSATLGLVEAVCNGITTTVEAGTVAHPDRVLAAFDRVGVGGTLGTWGWDATGQPWAGSVDEVLDRQRAVLALTEGHPRVSGWVTLVGHDLMSDELVAAASDLARRHGTGLSFHLSPTRSDAERYLERTGRRPLVHLRSLGCLGDHVLVGHGVHLDDDEVEVVLDERLALAYCPWAYLRLGQGVSGAGRHAEIVRRGGRVALGCDAENAGGAIDILRTAALAAGLSKDMVADPARWGARTALELATVAGAAAIGQGDEIGSLRPGKRADVVLIDTTGPEWIPASPDPVPQLVWSSDGRAVRHVVASGRVVVRDGEPTLVDRSRLAEAAAEHHARLVRDARLGGPSPTESTG